MPLVRVRALPQPASVDVPRVLASVNAAVARALAAPLDSVWSTWETIPPAWYVEGDRPAREQPRGTHPPLADVSAFGGRSATAIEAAIEGVARALVDGLALDEGNAFVTYREARSGRVFTGGAVRKS